MSTQPLNPPQHPVLACLDALEAELAQVAEVDPTCRAEGCDIPAAWCEAHHDSGRWADGAGTDAKDGALLCPFLHHQTHDNRYDQTRLPNGRVRFNKRE